MITIRPGSHIHRLLQLLATAGEIPASALRILGNERVIAALVHKLESAQEIRFYKNGPVYHVRLFQLTGIKGDRIIRLYKKGLPILERLHQGALDCYLGASWGHRFPGDRQHAQRNRRVAETLAMCMAAGVETRPYVLPALQKNEIRGVVPDSPCFYSARELKRAGGGETNKTAYTRLTGALFYPGGAYAVYNTRGAAMKWSGLGEIKSLGNLTELARMNAGASDMPTAMLLGNCPDTALHTILESDRGRRPDLRFDRIYNQIHYIPLSKNGARLLKILVTPGWSEKLLGALFEDSQRSYNRGVMEYDAIVGGTIVLSHLDSDIARLIRFREALIIRARAAEVLCYPWQTVFLRAYLGNCVGIRELEMDDVEAALFN